LSVYILILEAGTLFYLIFVKIAHDSFTLNR